MKVLLTIMIVLMSKSVLRTIYGLFISKEDRIKILKADTENVLDDFNGDTELFRLLFILASFIITAYFILFYILSAVYVKSLVFTTVSALFILTTLKSFIGAINWIDTWDYDSLLGVTHKIGNIVWLGYMGYLIYFIITTW